MSARRAAVLVGFLATLGVTLYQVGRYERLLTGAGELVYLQLAPVDPRSLMQGDYMALRYALEDAVQPWMREGEGGADESGQAVTSAPFEEWPVSGRLALRLDEARVARGMRLLVAGEAPVDGEVGWRYRVDDGLLRLAPDSWFFEEGQGEALQTARYGVFHVAADGTPMLVGLADEDLRTVSQSPPRWYRRGAAATREP